MLDLGRVLSCRWCIVTCSKRKIWDVDRTAPRQVPARDAYVGQVYRLARKIAETLFRDRWCIISGKYGLIRPDTLIESYDMHIVPTRNFIEKIREQARVIGIEPPVLVLAGTDYVKTLRLAFPNWDMYTPLEGRDMFQMLRILRELHSLLERMVTRRISKLF